METRKISLFIISIVLTLTECSQRCPPQCVGCAGNTANCAQSGLRDIPPSYPDDIVIVDLTGNQITELNGQSFPTPLPNVQSLRLSGNGISSIDDDAFVNTPMLFSLDLSMNPITLIHDRAFAGLTKLRTITLTHNNLRVIGKGFSDLTSLSSLHMGFNQLTEIQEDDFEGNTQLRMLELSNNRIGKIHPNAFKNLQMLRYLVLNNNPIVSAVDLQFTSKMLQLVDFTKCQLTSVPKRFPASVADFRLGSNEITSIHDDDFEGMTNLMLLTMNDNMLKNISYRSLKNLNNLKEVWLSNNQLFYFPHGVPPNVEKFFINNNQLYEVPEKILPADSKITEISFEMNDIMAIEPKAFEGLEHLQKLNFQGNKINEIQSRTFYDLPSLSQLDLSNNPIFRIQSEGFGNVPNLTSLTLSHIRTSDIQISDDFVSAISNVNHIQLLDSPNLVKKIISQIQRSRSMPGVQVLDLSYNDIMTLPEMMRQVLVNIQRLILDGNMFHCDKRLIWFKRWMQENNVAFFNSEPPTCSSPAPVQGEEIQNLPENRFVDYVPESDENPSPTKSVTNVLPENRQNNLDRSGVSALDAVNGNSAVLLPTTLQPTTPRTPPRRRKGKKRKGKKRKGKKRRKGKKKRGRGKRNKKNRKGRRLRRIVTNRKKRCRKLPDGSLKCRRGRRKKNKKVLVQNVTIQPVEAA